MSADYRNYCFPWLFLKPYKSRSAVFLRHWKGISLQKSSDLPFNVTNHGNMDQEEFLSLLRTSRVYVGLESPLEGPAALEAVSQGTVFLNPKFDPPRRLDPSKPTIRKLKSQSPYAEEYIGECRLSFELQKRSFYKKNVKLKTLHDFSLLLLVFPGLISKFKT